MKISGKEEGGEREKKKGERRKKPTENTTYI